MELKQTTSRVIHNVEAEQEGWKLNASVTLVDGVITEISGNANGDQMEDGRYGNSASFYGHKEDGDMRINYSFRHEDADVCATLTEMVNAIVETYGK